MDQSNREETSLPAEAGVAETASRVPVRSTGSGLAACLRILPLAATLTSYVPGVGIFYGFRVLLVLFLFFQLVGGHRPSFRISLNAGRALVLVASWLAVGCLAVIVYGSSVDVLPEFFYVLIGGLTVVAIVNMRTDRKAFDALLDGWVVATIVNCTIGLYEVLSGLHLPNYLPGTDLLLVDADTSLLASGFGNPNGFATFLVLAAPFVVLQVWFGRTSHRRAVAVIAGAALVATLPGTGSRLGLVALAVEVLVLLWASRRWTERLRTCAILATALIVGATVVGPFGLVSSELASKIDPRSAIAELTESDGDTSGARRGALNANGWELIRESPIIGLGPGSFSARHAAGDVKHDTAGLVDPHNGYVEIGAQYGLVLLFTLVLLFLRLALRVLRQSRLERQCGLAPSSVVLAGLAGLGIAAISSSSMLSSPVVWLAVGSYWLLSRYAWAPLLDKGPKPAVQRQL